MSNMKTKLNSLLGEFLTCRSAARLLLLAILALVLAGSSPARAQDSLESLEEAILLLDAPNTEGLLNRINAIEQMIDREKVGPAIHQLNALANVLEAASYYDIFEEIIDDILASIDQIIEDLVSPPGPLVMWYVDMDNDNSFVEVGLYTSAPFPWASTSYGEGIDCDDTVAWLCNLP